MSWYLGVDAGGSFTRAAILNPETGDLGEGHAGPGNPFAVSPERAFEAIEQAVAGALAQVGCHAYEVDAACFGVAGIARLPLPADWTERFAEWRLGDVSIVSDLEIAHFAAFQGEPGIQVIAGTGSSVLLKDAVDRSHVYGGWGWLLGDEGSAIDLGRSALVHLASAGDAGGSPDTFSRAVLAALDIDSAAGLVPRLYGDSDSRQVLAKLAPLVTGHAAGGDPVAGRLVAEAAGRLAEVVRRAAARMGTDSAVPVATAGSVFRADVFAGAFARQLEGGAPQVAIRRCRWSPLAGAVLRAGGQSPVAGESAMGERLLGL